MVGRAEAVAAAVEVDHEDLKMLIQKYFEAKKALFVWGATGIGKSQTVRQAAMELAAKLKLEYTDDIRDINDEKKFLVIDLRLSQMDI